MVLRSPCPLRATRSLSLESAVVPKHVRFVTRQCEKDRQQSDASVLEKQAYAQACREGNLAEVKEFVRNHRASIDCQLEDKATGLLIAAQNGRVAVVVYLCCQGANPCYVKPKSEGGNSILQCLLSSSLILSDDQLQCIQYILDNVVKVSKRARAFGQGGHFRGVDHLNSDEETALVFAIRNHHVEIVKLLLKCGADINIVTKSGKKMSDLVWESKNRAIARLFLEKLMKQVGSGGWNHTLSVFAKMYPKEDQHDTTAGAGGQDKKKIQLEGYNMDEIKRDVIPPMSVNVNDDVFDQPQPLPIPCKRQLSDEDFTKLKYKNKNRALILLKLEGLQQYEDIFDNAGISFRQFLELSEQKLDELGIENAGDRKKILDIVNTARSVDSGSISRSLRRKRPKWEVSSSINNEKREQTSVQEVQKSASGNRGRGYLIFPALIGLMIFGFNWFLSKKG